MPRGSKSAYTDKQKRQPERIEESYEERGRSTATAERATSAKVNKQDGGRLKKKSSTRGGKKATRSIGGSKKKSASTRSAQMTDSTEKTGARKKTGSSGPKRATKVRRR